MKHFHEKQKLGGSVFERHPGKGLNAAGLNKGKKIISSDQSSLQGDKKMYAAVVQGLDHSLNLNFQDLACKSKVGEAALEKFNGSTSLVDEMSAEKEKEKDVILTREEEVGVVTVRNMFSEFKKDLLKSLESFLVGWTPPSDVANRAKKGADSGRPKMNKEKPKPLVKLTYFRRKSARPKMCWQKIIRPETSLNIGSVLSPIQTFKPSGAVRLLEKGEESGAGPGLASQMKVVIPANDISGNPKVLGGLGRRYRLLGPNLAKLRRMHVRLCRRGSVYSLARDPVLRQTLKEASLAWR